MKAARVAQRGPNGRVVGRDQMRLTAQQRRLQQRISAQLADIDFALPGSIEVRRTRCGKSTCRCHADPDSRHGPYNVWTRKVSGRTVTKVLSEDELRDYRGWLDNSRRLRELVNELHQLTLQVVDAQQPTATTRSSSQAARAKTASAKPR